MRGLVLAHVRRFELTELADPVPGPHDAVVRVRQSGICGSELGGFLGTDGLRHPGMIFGHEFIGTVEAYGSSVPAGSRLAPGTLVTANPLRSCGRCRICRGGQPNVCPRRQLLGGHVDGSNAELVAAAAESLYPVDHFDHPLATVLSEPTACALRAVARTPTPPGGSALVLGAGPIGQLLLEVLHADGVTPLLFTERNEGRVPAATTGGGHRLSSDPDELLDQVHRATDGLGVDTVFDAVGSDATRTSAVACVRAGGNVCFVGLHSAGGTLPVRDLIRREITCTTSFAYGPADFAQAVDRLGRGTLTFHGEVVRADLAQGQHWYEQLIDGHAAGKVVLEP